MTVADLIPTDTLALSLHSTDAGSGEVFDAITLNSKAGAEVPTWVHLFPAPVNGIVRTANGAGPFRVSDPQAVIDASFAQSDRLPIDVNHATDLAAPQGGASPAQGWIMEMDARADGIWGRVDWTQSGRALLSDRAYRAISPVVQSDRATQELKIILRASLVNTPNLPSLTTLNSEKEPVQMDWKKMLIEMLGLAGGVSDEEIKSALTKALKANNGKNVQAMSEIATALGIEGEPEPDAVVTTLNSRLADAPSADEVSLLREALANTKTLLNQIEEDRKRDQEDQKRQAAETFINTAIDRKVMIPAHKRNMLISLHMRDPETCEELVGAMPIAGETHTSLRPPAPKEGEVTLNSSQLAVAKQLGISPEDYSKTLENERKKEEIV